MRHKILFISSWYPSRLETTNGNFVQRHAEAAALNHDVEVLHAVGDSSLKKAFEITESVVNGIRTIIIYYKNSRNPIKNFRNRMKAYRFGFKMMNFPNLVHANVLHNTMLFAVYLKKKYGIPFVVSEHWSGFLKQNRAKLSSPARIVAKTIAKHASQILPVSEDLGRSLISLGIKTPQTVVPNVVNCDLFSPQAASSHDDFVFLHISNLIKIKNPDEIILSTIRLKREGFNVRLEIGGDGDTESLSRLAEQHNAAEFINVFGELTHPEVAKKMQAADCFVLFSDYENLPCVLLESLSCGVPVISSDVGGVKEIVKDGYGLLIPKGNVEALYEAMKTLVTNEVDLKTPEKLSDYVRQNYSVNVISDKFSDIYRQVLKT